VTGLARCLHPSWACQPALLLHTIAADAFAAENIKMPAPSAAQFSERFSTFISISSIAEVADALSHPRARANAPTFAPPVGF